MIDLSLHIYFSYSDFIRCQALGILICVLDIFVFCNLKFCFGMRLFLDIFRVLIFKFFGMIKRYRANLAPFPIYHFLMNCEDFHSGWREQALISALEYNSTEDIVSLYLSK